MAGCVLSIGFAIAVYFYREKQFAKRTSCVANQIHISLSKEILAQDNGWPNGFVIPAGLVDPNHPLFNLRDFAGQIAIHTWPGQPEDPATQVGGTEWILASKWVPFQQSTFVTPAFPGYISGHSTFSRSAAEVLTSLTGSEYFPGGLEEYTIPAGGLDFELGPTQDITLGWATYYDAADQAGQSRLWGGIHVSVDDLTGRSLGSQVGRDAYALASSYYSGVPEPASAFAVGSMLMLLVLRRRIVA